MKKALAMLSAATVKKSSLQREDLRPYWQSKQLWHTPLATLTHILHFTPIWSPSDSWVSGQNFKAFQVFLDQEAWQEPGTRKKNKSFVFKGLPCKILIRFGTIIHFEMIYTMTEGKLKFWILARSQAPVCLLWVVFWWQ